ncbi:MAG: patatin-like phospholipase family protein [Rhabdochlamydiaceae bacterium]|nr:patatin-like phospholipase family protein [Rhabdochlamydiaceae bacterium]
MTTSDIDADHPFLDYENSIFPHLKELDKPTLAQLYQKIDHVNQTRRSLNAGAGAALFSGIALACISRPLTACCFGLVALACKTTALFFHKPPPYLILSIDGGGIRGMLPIQILAHIEEELGCKIGEVFDCITGTSIGGILALALAAPDPENPSKPKMGAKETAAFLEKEGPLVFEKTTLQSIKSIEGIRTPKYSNENLKKVLHDQFNETKIDEAVTDVLIPSYDLNKGKTAIFFHFKGQNTNQPFFMRDAGMATSAAPTYFPSYAVQDLNLVDGGLSANNPSLLAYMKAAGHIDPDRDIFILSLGTGEMKIKSIPAAESESYGMIQWLPMIFDIIFKSSQEMQTLQLKLLKQKAPLTVVRLQPTLQNASQEQLDNASPANIKSLKQIATKYFNDNLPWLQKDVIQPLRKYRLVS